MKPLFILNKVRCITLNYSVISSTNGEKGGERRERGENEVKQIVIKSLRVPLPSRQLLFCLKTAMKRVNLRLSVLAIRIGIP